MTLLVNRIANDSDSGPPILQYGFKVESNNSNWIHLKAPDGLASNYTLMLPSSGNEFLVAPTGSVPVLLAADGTIKHTNAPYLYARHTANETLAAGATLTAWTVDINSGTATFTSGVYTASKTGRYLVALDLLKDTTVGGTAGGVYINKNNANFHRIIFAGGSSGYLMCSGTMIVQLNAGDTLKFVNQSANMVWYGGDIGSLTIAYLG